MITRTVWAFMAVCGMAAAWHAWGLHAGAPPVSSGPSDCANCHVAPHPTHDSAELKGCTRPEDMPEEVTADSDEVADVLLLDQLSDLYVPVVFPHKLHAAMTEMGEGCSICHHRNPEGPILKCSECHGGASNPVNLRQPGLKGAFHRQCLGCHREWTHETDCVVCHAKREPGVEVKLPEDPTDIMGMLHPNIEEPDVKVFEIENELLEDMPYVTFHHKQHIDVFGYQCVDCHQEESCNRCHDTGHKTPHIKADPHEDCMQCHQEQIDMDCAHCHAEEVREAGFSHADVSGFDTALYHSLVGCNECHTDRANAGFTGLEANCASCHDAEFAPEEFDHATTGVPLGFLHSDASCIDCHTEGIGGPVTCVSCHDDDRNVTTVEEIP